MLPLSILLYPPSFENEFYPVYTAGALTLGVFVDVSFLNVVA
jgi:hypothetical protein